MQLKWRRAAASEELFVYGKDSFVRRQDVRIRCRGAALATPPDVIYKLKEEQVRRRSANERPVAPQRSEGLSWTADQILARFRQMSSINDGADRVERVVRTHPSWTTDRLQISTLSFSAASVMDPRSQRLIRKYAALSTASPPILVEPGIDAQYEIVDGFHRVAAALRRGESSIDVYRPVRIEVCPHEIER